MKVKAMSTTKSVAILATFLLGTWLLVVCFGMHTETPSNDPWTWFPEYYLPPLPWLIAPWLAARRWYGLPVFFGFGSFFVFPIGCSLFGPETRHGFVAATPPHFVPETLAFCCAGGFVASFVGWCSHRFHTSAAPNHALQPTAGASGAHFKFHG